MKTIVFINLLFCRFFPEVIPGLKNTKKHIHSRAYHRAHKEATDSGAEPEAAKIAARAAAQAAVAGMYFFVAGYWALNG